MVPKVLCTALRVSGCKGSTEWGLLGGAGDLVSRL